MVSSAPSGNRVLLVEDEMILMLELEDVLSEAGFEVVGPVARVREALALIDSKPIDAAVVDVNLGNEKSYPIADALMARQVPFFFLTGYDSLEEGYQSIPRLQKPMYPGQLEEMLDAIIIRARKAQPAGTRLSHPEERLDAYDRHDAADERDDGDLQRDDAGQAHIGEQAPDSAPAQRQQ